MVTASSPTVFIFLGQFVGVGTVVPLFYFLCIVFGPSALDLTRASRRLGRCKDDGRTIVPVIMLFHTSVVFAMFTAGDLADRHYWTWAWQLSPIWIGLGNAAARRALAHLQLEDWSPSMVGRRDWLNVFGWLDIIDALSFGVWGFTLFAGPHSLPSLFIPPPEPQVGLVLHMRKALQMDEIMTVVSNGLWLAYTFAELHLVGLLGYKAVGYVALYPIMVLCIGPGATFALFWQLREDILDGMMAS